MKPVSLNYCFYVKKHSKRCPHCGFLDVIKKGKRSGHTRYYCKSCGRYFTDRWTSVSLKNKEVWFREWVIGKQTIEQLASHSNYSVRHLKSYFYQVLPHCPVWHIQHREKVNLLIDDTYFPNKVCLALYRDVNVQMALFYRLTAGERYGSYSRTFGLSKRCKYESKASPVMEAQPS